eukprot:862263_1
MADKLEFNPGALSIFIGLLLLVVTLFIGFMLIKDGGTSGTGRTCGNVYGIDQCQELNHQEYGKKRKHQSPSLLSTAEFEDVNRRLAEENKNEHNNSVKLPYMAHKMAYRKKMNERGITDFKMFSSREKLKILFKDSQYADVKEYSFRAVLKSADDKKSGTISRILWRKDIVGDRNGGDSAQKQFTWNPEISEHTWYDLKAYTISKI